MHNHASKKLLFVINPGSGNGSIDWHSEIKNAPSLQAHQVILFDLPQPCSLDKVHEKIMADKPDIVVACGGDGTIKLVAECILDRKMVMGVLPAGSANGMAKELGIPSTAPEAIELLVTGVPQEIHAIRINKELCIHLSDIGFNAYVVKRFESGKGRGMWGYIKAAWHVLWNHSKMQVKLHIDDAYVTEEAAMIVIANATKYGSGALINPLGRLDDGLFEVIVLKKVSFGEIFKMIVTHQPFDPEKTRVLQTRSLRMQSKQKVHFQVDGEYLGKTNAVEAELLKDALQIIVPVKAAES